MHKNNFVENLKEGMRFEDVFLVKSSRIAETRAGKPYLILELADKSGEISGPIWDVEEDTAKICSTGNFILLRGQVQSYRDKLQLRIEHVTPVPQQEVVLADFVPSTPYDMNQMAEQVQLIVSSVENGWIRKLLQRFLSKGEWWQKFQLAPAAKGMHHAYAGGLMEHCLSMARVADMMAKHYVDVDRSLLLAGVFFHDIGKLQELKEEIGVVEYTTPGRLKGHLVLGCEMVAREAATIKDFPDNILMHIQHLILSHHGKLEFGSPTLPMTPEAMILSYVDDLDSKMNMIEQLRRRQKEDGERWSEYQRSLERFLLLRPLERAVEKTEQEEHHLIQKRLF